MGPSKCASPPPPSLRTAPRSSLGLRPLQVVHGATERETELVWARASVAYASVHTVLCVGLRVGV